MKSKIITANQVQVQVHNAEQESKLTRTSQSKIDQCDAKCLDLTSPEIEKFLSIKGISTANQTSAMNTNWNMKTPTEEQEKYALGFVEALNFLYDKRGQPNFLSTQDNSIENITPIVIKEEPEQNTETFQSSVSKSISTHIKKDFPNKSRIDYKRERNRAAARKCRYKKLEKIDSLEKRIQELKEHNNILSKNYLHLINEIECLKTSLKQHQEKGCSVSIPDFTKI